MTKVNVYDLSTLALDWAVAKCEALPIIEDPMGFKKDFPDSSQTGFWVWEDAPKSQYMLIGDNYSPSTNWVQGGEIINRKNISIKAPSDEYSHYRNWTATSHDGSHQHEGESALIAASRVYVQSVFGDTIDVPDSLISA